MPPRTELDVAIVGAGFAGIYMLHRARGLGLRARAFEAGSGVGGTWFWNRYPGARCDIESFEYSYQFSEELQQEWEWTERFASQAEILRYLNHVVDRFDLRRDIELEARVRSARFDEASGRWELETERGDASARFCVMATGCLSATNLPSLPGLERFEGEVWHTARWPEHGVDVRGRRVGVVGTGSSAIQSIPILAAQAAQLTVFQRTPAFSVPAGNRPLVPGEQERVKADYPRLRRLAAQQPFGADFGFGERGAFDLTPEEREHEYEERWQRGGLRYMAAFRDLMLDRAANETAAEFVRAKIRQTVRDPAVAEALSPRTLLGCKRLCADDGYYETFNRPNVALVDLSAAPIEEATPRGLRTRAAEYPLDVLVFATGFDAMTGALFAVDPRGRGGLSLREKWAAGPRTYLGLATAGFPNLFLVTGPGSPSVLANMVPAIEQHVDWIAACLEHLGARGLASVEALPDAEAAWGEHVNAVAHATLFPSCGSWYLGANVPGKPRVFMPYVGFPPYVKICAEVAAKGYEGFALA